MASTGPKTDAGKGTGATRPATGLYIDDNKDMILSVGEGDWVYVDETAILIERSGEFIVVQHQVGGKYQELVRVNVG